MNSQVKYKINIDEIASSFVAVFMPGSTPQLVGVLSIVMRDVHKKSKAYGSAQDWAKLARDTLMQHQSYCKGSDSAQGDQQSRDVDLDTQVAQLADIFAKLHLEGGSPN